MKNPLEDDINNLNITKSISHLLFNQKDVVVDIGLEAESEQSEPTSDGWARYDYGECYTISIKVKRVK
ncbi:hypothetical protein [Bacillus wiedmannii]|uniref:hypothetical protein n=1 Tax=Bacillus wiedmannii TaxID=1890302 RepID=UPI000BFC2FD3|nr:hypothetical protein [Bacillus wiedmannii]PHF94202.1 hypothetical protein COI45_15480 [Bacillus wiedmannii]